MHSAASTDSHQAQLIKCAHRILHLTLLGILPIALVLWLSKGTTLFWVYGFLYGISLLLGGIQVRLQRRILLCVAPSEVRAWMQVAFLGLSVSGATLLALSAWTIGIRLAAI